MKESDIQKAILDWLRIKQYTHWRNYVGPIIRGHTKKFSANPMSGLPDIMGLLNQKPGHLFCIEVKQAKGRMSQKQIEWRERLEDAGVKYMVARSLMEVIEQFDIWENGW